MIIANRLKKLIKQKGVSLKELAEQLSRSGLKPNKAKSALINWQKGLMKPIPTKADVDNIAQALGVSSLDLQGWKAAYKYAPVSARKARLITELINGRDAQDALDILKFTHKRPARFVEELLKSAIANADEQEADVENLYVHEARVDGGGVRIGTKRWHPKDRGRAHPIRKECSHIVVTLAQENV